MYYLMSKLQMKKWRLREVTQFAAVHTDYKQ